MIDTSVYRVRTGAGSGLAAVLQHKCRMCSRWRSPYEFVAGGSITGYCLHCSEWHRHALDVLAGNPPKGCQECEKTFADLSADEPGADVRVYLHTKDGIYQLLCRHCSDDYERKRLDLFRHTPYGHAKKL